jgi:hypothetical protein
MNLYFLGMLFMLGVIEANDDSNQECTFKEWLILYLKFIFWPFTLGKIIGEKYLKNYTAKKKDKSDET